jgi:hypothetical protein
MATAMFHRERFGLDPVPVAGRFGAESADGARDHWLTVIGVGATSPAWEAS